MIRRTSSNKATPSLVNTANQDHLNVTKAIKDTAPIVDLTSVARSINFDAATDGSYILRYPLILKDRLSMSAFYLYDDATIFNKYSDLYNVTQIIASEKELTIIFRYYDKTFKKFDIPIQNNMDNLSFITKYLKHVHTQDASLISVMIDRRQLDTFTYPYPSTLYDESYLKYGNELYRFLKIYKDPDLEDTWIVELVSPEIGTITSATDATNPESLEFNLLLDNPLAIRDLYDYGSNSTTKVLAYAVKSDLNIDTYPTYALTESNDPKIKMVESLNTVKYTSDTIYLKAFITTSKYNNIDSMDFYCIWEYSTNGGVDWKPVPQFVSKFESKNRVVTKNVSDISAAGFEDMLEDESLTKSADYIVSKSLVSFDPNMSETDIVDDRPDILKLTSSQLSYLFRFQVYVDTHKTFPKVEDELDNITLYPGITCTEFTTTGNGNAVTFSSGDSNIIYRTYICNGTDSSGEQVFKSKITVTVENTEFECYSTATISSDADITSPILLYLQRSSEGSEYYEKAGYLQPADDNSNVPFSTDFVKGFATFKEATTITSVTKMTDNIVPVAPEARNGCIYLHAGHDNRCGNSIVVSVLNEKYKIYAVQVTLGTRETIDNVDHYTDADIGCRFGSAITSEESFSNFEIHNIQAGNSAYFFYPTPNYQATGPAAEEQKRANDSDVVTVSVLENSPENAAKIYSITVFLKHFIDPVKTTSTFLVSSTGYFSFKYSEDLVPVGSNLLEMHENLFKGTFSYYDEQLFSNYKGYVYVSGLDSLIFKVTNTFLLGTNVTKVLKWRSYLVIFTEICIYLAKYNVDGTYILKVISTNIGLSAIDADTATVILNSIYFKNKEKIYSLSPNPYSSDDSILNIKYISEDVFNFLSDIQIYCTETHNFKYSDAKYYYIFIPTNYDLERQISASNITYCLKYNYISKTWTILKYPTTLLGIEDLSITESYLRTSLGLCYFNLDAQIIYSNYVYKTTWYSIGYSLENPYSGESTQIGYTDDVGNEALAIAVFADEIDEEIINHESLLHLYQQLPYADYFKNTLYEINQYVIEHQNSNSVNDFIPLLTQIPFLIDFGQKSSNYTLDKQFLESKLIFGTLQVKDVFPVTLDIETDGESPTIHIDANTDSALWKTTSDHKGTLNTTFATNNTVNYNGIMRQLIVKYSGRGKTIRHYLSGESITRFKFYSLDSRYRILPKKQ